MYVKEEDANCPHPLTYPITVTVCPSIMEVVVKVDVGPRVV